MLVRCLQVVWHGGCIISEFAGQRITVMGLGRFGGGLGVTQWLLRQGARVLVTDMLPQDKLASSHQSLLESLDADTRSRLSFRFGTHDESDFTSADLIIVNPAVAKPWENRFLSVARTAGVPVTTEIRLLVERLNRQRVIGITGSAGKSTTTAMIHHALNSIGACAHLGGNIGGSLLGSLDDIDHDRDWVVLELSSAMLYWLDTGVGYDGARGFSPHVAVLTNLAPNHLDWHGSFEHYEASKRVIFKHQSRDDLGIDCTHQGPGPEAAQGPISLAIPGAHNQQNARVAARAVSRALGIDPRTVAPHLTNFRGLPHRLELVTEVNGVRYYSDSKSTIPEATLLAVKSFDDPGKVHLIAGGYDKKIDLSSIAQLAPHLAGLYTIGATGPQIAGATSSRNLFQCDTLEVAVQCAADRAKEGDVILLSPGCASWDQFENYEQRGDAFANLARNPAGYHPRLSPHS